MSLMDCNFGVLGVLLCEGAKSTVPGCGPLNMRLCLDDGNMFCEEYEGDGCLAQKKQLCDILGGVDPRGCLCRHDNVHLPQKNTNHFACSAVYFFLKQQLQRQQRTNSAVNPAESIAEMKEEEACVRDERNELEMERDVFSQTKDQQVAARLQRAVLKEEMEREHVALAGFEQQQAQLQLRVEERNVGGRASGVVWDGAVARNVFRW